jgi:hypothetical protein
MTVYERAMATPITISALGGDPIKQAIANAHQDPLYLRVGAGIWDRHRTPLPRAGRRSTPSGMQTRQRAREEYPMLVKVQEPLVHGGLGGNIHRQLQPDYRGARIQPVTSQGASAVGN